jgi:hydroxyethylthiazole kinase-like uncharacterized protein yjeF
MKVVTASEMTRIEALSFSRGAKDEEFMERVGKNIAWSIPQFFDKSHPIILLCGKGNNAADAYVTGCYLLEKGYKVEAWQLLDLKNASPLCQKNANRFLSFDGVIKEGLFANKLDTKTIFLDGIFGTGFQGSIKSPVKEVIEYVNQTKHPIFSIDIPSGINGDTGTSSGVAIKADYTFFLQLPKTGFFINEGPKHTGKLFSISFGLDSVIINEAIASYNYIDETLAVNLLPPIERIRHKYQRGYVVGLSGSKLMPGASILSSESALRGGAGIIRLLLPVDAQEQVALLSPEIIRFFYSSNDLVKIKEYFNEASSVYIGPGIGLSEDTKSILKEILKEVDKPLVLDADALTILSEDSDIKIPKNAILTPHLGEMAKLLHVTTPKILDEAFLAKCQEFATHNDVVLVLKGVPTFIFTSSDITYVSDRGDPGMATAGSGDVLTGLIAALLAQKLTLKEAAILAVFLHSLAGEIAASEKSSYSLMASDIIEAIPKAYKTLEMIKNN